MISKRDEEYVASIKKDIAERAGELQSLDQPHQEKKNDENTSPQKMPDLYSVSLSAADKNYVSKLKSAIETRAKALREMEEPEILPKESSQLSALNKEVKGLGDSVVMSAEEQAQIKLLLSRTAQASKSLAALSDQGMISKGEQEQLDELKDRITKRSKWLSQNGH